MTSKVIVPVSDFAAIITRIEKLEDELTARKEREAKRYNHGPCLRCGYGPWESFRAAAPKCCPRCHSAYWDTEPRHKGARSPEDPPNPKWTSGPKPGPRERAAARVVVPVVEVATPPLSRTPVVLPPELRPPGEPLIPPPPLPDVVAARTVDNPMNVRPLSEQLAEIVRRPQPDPMPGIAPSSIPNGFDEPLIPVEHVAPLPDTIVERILATGESATIDEIREAREGDDGPVTRTVRDGAEQGVPPSPETSERPTPPALQAKKDAFFADAIEAGLVSADLPAQQPDASPFVAPSLGDTVAKLPDDDPFWK